MIYTSKTFRLFGLIIALISLGYFINERRHYDVKKFSLADHTKGETKWVRIIESQPHSDSCSNFPPSMIKKYDGPIDKSKWINFSNPKDYKGPVVEGWAPNVSRNVKLYARPDEETTLLRPINLAGDEKWCESVKMIIFQHSRPDGFAKRLDNRRTWMNYMKEEAGIKSFFVVGHPTGPKATLIQKLITEEHKLYGDILQVDFVEHPNNNTLKTILALKYILSINWKAKPPEYVMKTDDDVYLNLPLFEKVLFSNSNFVMKDNAAPILGYLFVVSDVLQIQPEKVNEVFTDYLICPSYMYSETSYPTFTSGTGYIIPWWAIYCVYQESLALPYFFIEDVYIGGFVADRCYLNKINLPGYSPLGKSENEIRPKEDLLIHYVDHNNKFNIHNIMTDSHNQALEI